MVTNTTSKTNKVAFKANDPLAKLAEEEI